MIVSSIQPCFIPWLGYFEQIEVADLFIYLDDDRYSRRNWRNTNLLKSPQGEKRVSVPVKKASQRGLLNEAEISYAEDWQGKLLNQIEQWYGPAPYFGPVFAMIRDVITAGHSHLVELDIELNRRICDYLGIGTPFRRSSEVPRATDDRNGRIIEICSHFGADLLYDGKSAADFIDVPRFREAGIEVVFQDYRHPEYSQLWGGFMPQMSVVDLLMNHGPDAYSILLSSPLPDEFREAGGA